MVAMRGPGDDDGSPASGGRRGSKQECRALILPERVEGDGGSTVSQTFYGGLDGCRTIQLFCAIRDVESVQPLDVLGSAAGLRLCQDVDRAAGPVHDGSSDDADIRLDVYVFDISVRPPSLASS